MPLLILSLAGMLVQSNGTNMNKWRLSSAENVRMHISNTNKGTEYDDSMSSKRNDKTGVRLT